MDKNIIYGKAKVARGAVTKAVGNLVGSDKLKADGIADQLVGNAQSAIGKAKDILAEGRKANNEAAKNSDKDKADDEDEAKKNDKFFQSLADRPDGFS